MLRQKAGQGGHGLCAHPAGFNTNGTNTKGGPWGQVLHCNISAHLRIYGVSRIIFMKNGEFMTAIQTSELPQIALLNKYKQQGAYTDCYFMDLPRAISQAEYVAAFYTTGLFKVERAILSLLVAKPSTDLQAKQLAAGKADHFAAWSVEGRATNQLLLCDFQGRTRSWLMSVVDDSNNPTRTRLYFGSAVVPVVNKASGKKSLGIAFYALMGFHRLYSRSLMASARARLLR
jgi:hypothetical protein